MQIASPLDGSDVYASALLRPRVSDAMTFGCRLPYRSENTADVLAVAYLTGHPCAVVPHALLPVEGHPARRQPASIRFIGG